MLDKPDGLSFVFPLVEREVLDWIPDIELAAKHPKMVRLREALSISLKNKDYRTVTECIARLQMDEKVKEELLKTVEAIKSKYEKLTHIDEEQRTLSILMKIKEARDESIEQERTDLQRLQKDKEVLCEDIARLESALEQVLSPKTYDRNSE
jgi:Asp-tRNA(Asn)/Glu-tRNA(Gln) amidotransferase C subunit